MVNARRLSDNKIQLKFRTKEFEGEYFHYTGDLFFIYKTGHLMKLMCQKHEGVRGEGFRPRVALIQHLCSTFLAAVGHVIDLSRETDADLHELATSGALGAWAARRDLGLSWALTIRTSRPLMRL